MCNHLSLSSHVDKTYFELFLKEEKARVCIKIFLRGKVGREEPLCMSRKSKTFERKRKKRNKNRHMVFSEFPRVSAWGSGSEKVSYVS